MDEIWATQRAEYGYRDVRPTPPLVDFAGHPYVDVRASFASFLPSEVPEKLAGRLLAFYLGWLRQHPELHDKVEFEVVPTCLAPGFGSWEQRLRVDGGFIDQEINTLRTGLCRITAGAFERYMDDLAAIERLGERFDALQSDSRINPLERARILLDDCRRLGTLPFAHLARNCFVAVTLLREEAVGIAARRSERLPVRTVSHRDGRAGDSRWRAAQKCLLYTLRPPASGDRDITSPRYDLIPSAS